MCIRDRLVDGQNQLPPNVKFFKETSPILVANLHTSEQAGHIERVCLPENKEHVCLRSLLLDLAKRGCNDVLVEAGAGLAGAFFRQGLVDELITYVAPKMMGSDARALFDLPLSIMDESLPIRFTDVRTIGRDIRITAVPEGE